MHVHAYSSWFSPFFLPLELSRRLATYKKSKKKSAFIIYFVPGYFKYKFKLHLLLLSHLFRYIDPLPAALTGRRDLQTYFSPFHLAFGIFVQKTTESPLRNFSRVLYTWSYTHKRRRPSTLDIVLQDKWSHAKWQKILAWGRLLLFPTRGCRDACFFSVPQTRQIC